MEINKYFKLIYKIVKLPLLKITLDNSLEGRRIHSSFNKIHSRYLFIKQKSIGIALIKLRDFNNAEDYIKSVNGKNSAAYFSRKAVKAGYGFKSIEINNLTNEIFEINNSDEKMSYSDFALQNTKMLFGRHCFCRGQAGYFKVNQGTLTLERKKGSSSIDLDFKIAEVPQLFTKVKATIE